MSGYARIYATVKKSHEVEWCFLLMFFQISLILWSDQTYLFYVRRSCAMLPNLPMSFSVPQPIDRVQLSDCPSDVSLPILEAPLLTINHHQPLWTIINYYEPSSTIFLTGITPTFLPWDASPTQASRWASTPWRAWNLEKPKDFHPSWQKKCEIGKLGAKKVRKDVLAGPTKDQNKMKKIKNPNPYSPILLDQVIHRWIGLWKEPGAKESSRFRSSFSPCSRGPNPMDNLCQYAYQYTHTIYIYMHSLLCE